MAKGLTDEEIAALEAGTGSGGGGLTDAELAALETSQALDTAGSEAGDIVAGVLDYPGGITRAAVANAADLVVPGEIATSDDLLSALKGRAPSTEDYLERSGVPEGYSLSDVLPKMYSESGRGLPLQKGGWADPTARGTAGFVGDVLLDPAAHGSAVVSRLGKGGKFARTALTPIEALSEYFGGKIYKSAFKNIDKDLIAKGKAPLADKFLERGFRGNMQDAAKANLELGRESAQGIESTLSEAAKKGATVSMKDATGEALDLINKMKESPHPDVQAAANKMEAVVEGYLSKGETVPVDVANKWKTEVNDLAGKRAFDPIAQNLPMQDKVERGIGSGLNINIENAVGSTDQDLLNRLKEYKESGGSSLEARKSFKREANKEVTKNPVTAVDAMLLGGAAITPKSLAILGAKKAIERASSTAGRTNIGLLMDRFGKNAAGIPDALARRSIWELLSQQNEEK